MKAKALVVALLSVGLVLGTVFLCGDVLAGTVYTVKITHPDPTTAPDHLGFLYFKKLAEERSKGQLAITVHPSAILGNQREGLEMSQVGSVQMALSSGGISAAFVPEMGLIDVPFMFNSFKEARTAVDSPGMTKLLTDRFAQKGMQFLGFYENGFRNITNSKRPIKVLEDLKGLKIRTMEAPMHMLNFKALGASPTPMPFGEVYTSLQQGVIDGQENPFVIINLEKLYEVQKYVSVTNHVYDAMVVVASKKWFDSLPQTLQKIVVDSFRESVQYEYKVCTEISETSLTALLAKMQVNAVPPAELKKFKEIGQAEVKKALYGRIDPKTVDWWIAEGDKIVKEVSGN